MGYSIDTSKYLHTYEVYRIPEGSLEPNAKNLSISEDDGESQLVLTEESRKQVIADRFDYSFAMRAEQDRVHSKQEQETLKKYLSDQAKALAVYRNMSKGDIVPGSDERKLMEYDEKLYQAAKMAQMLAQREKAEKHDSEWDPKEEAEYQAKLRELQEIGNELVEGYNETFGKFVEAQSNSVVEIDADSVNLSEIKSLYSMGGGLAGAVVDIGI